MNPNVTENLVCPVCKGRLGWNAESEEFLCTACGLAFAVRDVSEQREEMQHMLW